MSEQIFNSQKSYLNGYQGQLIGKVASVNSDGGFPTKENIIKYIINDSIDPNNYDSIIWLQITTPHILSIVINEKVPFAINANSVFEIKNIPITSLQFIDVENPVQKNPNNTSSSTIIDYVLNDISKNKQEYSFYKNESMMAHNTKIENTFQDSINRNKQSS